MQCYGISLTHDSVNYHVDQTINPFCRRWGISFNEIWNLPDWQGIDAHGAYEVSAHHNKVYNCCLGISISGSSGDATPYGGANNEISFNTITIKKRDGSATSVTATARTGINISGGSTVSAKGCRAVGNYIEGYGDTTPNSDSIRALYCDDAIITENIISSWKGRGIHAANSSGVISNNTFGAVASDTNSSCVFLDTTTGKYTITGNKHALASGTGASIGIRINDAANPRSIISANDFSSATALTSGVDGTSTAGNSEITPRIDVSGAPATLDVSASRAAKEVWIFASLSSPTSYGDIIGAVIGQKITICDTGSNAITFTRANAALAGGANWVSTQYDALTLLCINTSGTKFIELHRSANS